MLLSQIFKQCFYVAAEMAVLVTIILLSMAVMGNTPQLLAVIIAGVIVCTAAVLYHAYTIYHLHDMLEGRLLADNRMVLEHDGNHYFINMSHALPGLSHWVLVAYASFILVAGVYEPITTRNLVITLISGLILLAIIRHMRTDRFYTKLNDQLLEVHEGKRLASGHLIHQLPSGPYIKVASLNSTEECLMPDTPELRAFLLKFAKNAVGYMSLKNVKAPPYTANQMSAPQPTAQRPRTAKKKTAA